MRKNLLLASLSVLAVTASVAHAEGFLGGDQGKLLLTAGFSTLEGSGGGALTPWSFIAGYGSNKSWGANAFATDVSLRDVELRSFGAAIGAFDRFEVSFAHQELRVDSGALDGLSASMDIVGAKIRLFGDAVYGQNSWLPQIAVGAQFKRHGGIDNFALTSVKQLGAIDTQGVDYFLSATKLSLAHNFLINVTLRATNANQLGLLGFGGDLEEKRSLRVETTIGYLLTRKVAIGGEYRSRPHNLSVDNEEAAWDTFIAWAPTKHLSVVAAYANIGPLLTPVTADATKQDGGYVSLQVGF
jgi:hypothetical protein